MKYDIAAILKVVVKEKGKTTHQHLLYHEHIDSALFISDSCGTVCFEELRIDLVRPYILEHRDPTFDDIMGGIGLASCLRMILVTIEFSFNQPKDH